jgi:hypothetical protein
MDSINFDLIVVEKSVDAEYLRKLKQALLDSGFEDAVRKAVDEMQAIQISLVPQLRGIKEVNDFEKILEYCILDLLVSQQFSFRVIIQATQDTYEISIGYSPK